MDPSIVKLRKDDTDETMHSAVDVEHFQAALTVLSLGNKNTSSQSLPKWPSPSHDSQADSRSQEPKAALLQVQHSLEVELKQHESHVEQLQHDASQDVNNPPLSQKQSQDECHQEPTVQVSLQNSQAIGIQNSGKDSVLNVSQCVKLQQMNNQHPTVTEQPNKQNYRIPKDKIPKDSFIQSLKDSVKDAVRDRMHRMVEAKVQSWMEKNMIRLNKGHAGQQHSVSMPTVSSGSRQLNDKSPKKRKKAKYIMTKSMKSEVSVGSKKGSHSDVPTIDSASGEDAPSLKSPRKEKEQTSNNGDKSETQEVPSPKRLRIELMEKMICCPKHAVKGANKSTERPNVSTSSPQHASKDGGPDEESTLSAPSLRIKSLKFSYKGIENPDSTSSPSKSKLNLDDQPQIGSLKDHPRQSLVKTPQDKGQGKVVESSSPPKVPGKLDQDQYLSSFDFFVYKQLLEEDPLAIMDKLLNGDLCQSSKALTTQTESTQNDDSSIEHLLKELKELAFSTQRPLTECLPFYPDLQSKIRILQLKLDRRMKDLTLEQLSFLSDFNKFFTDFLANIEASRTNYQQLEEFKSQHQDSLSKLRASKEKLSKFGESMEAGQSKVKTIDIQLRDLQAQISQLENRVKTLEQERDLLRLKCVEKKNEVIKVVKGISSDALHKLKKISELEQNEKLLYAKSDELRDAYAHLKSKLPF